MEQKLRRRIGQLILASCLFPALGAAKTMSLDGDWVFVPDPRANLQVADLARANGIPVRVPSSWQAAFVDRRDYAGVAWYWRNVVIEPPAAGQLLFVRFGAVDYRADVYINGQKVATHDGGYLPFEFDITALVHVGEDRCCAGRQDGVRRKRGGQGRGDHLLLAARDTAQAQGDLERGGAAAHPHRKRRAAEGGKLPFKSGDLVAQDEPRPVDGFSESWFPLPPATVEDGFQVDKRDGPGH